MINLERIARQQLQRHPYHWAEIGGLYSPEDAAALAETYPHDHFKIVQGYGGEKNYEYEARQLIAMTDGEVVNPQALSPQWLHFARDLRSPAYRQALGTLTGVDLSQAPMEVNLFHYGPGANLGPHPDLSDKVVTHILYFNETWDPRYGGCLQILNSRDPDSVVKEISPLVGNSAVLVRSDTSWHAVSRVIDNCHVSRRSVTVTFYRPGSTSSMWPEGDNTPLHDYPQQQSAASESRTGAYG
ncbi:2OG-Fe(II) oxygenase [Pseudomonas gingeri]|uniref:2OG-Fe(II) oxygenase n=1 Tax=Pseudomonas gingeri TaxID=117681 RepID=A0A7Y7YGP7_9PSED|nr:2OG-Fe(II) oxygenase [Pseudomonas gingeri]NWA02618.1 2OG-Fe(II) oxygenase [Pseudomonas gingeri]NWA12209.1 2OG-Fe(II) oxygenase [Pseudomonas gingeri]NWA57385.1 2OG-Fe(II) oxygenase [Pseudomonas gingeri]NWA93728.1 2OG-Fe(II) oxygenase [Pseudomonas gingeri]NWB03200.1 2OG-Fe(II) oxygenase [Pseudomonas gingeri]